MSQQAPVQGDQRSWQVEQFRLTGFIRPPGALSPRPVWQELTGEPPDEQIIRPKQGAAEESGDFGGGKLSFGLSLDRYDWLFHAQPLSQDLVSPIATLGYLDERVGLFQETMLKWLKKGSPDLGRLAFGATLMIPVVDHLTGYQRLSEYIPFPLDGNSTSDFTLTVNKPVQREYPGLPRIKVNRLQKWAVVKAMSVRMAMTPQGPIQSQTGEEFYAVRLELDINTDPGFGGVISAEQASVILKDLINEGLSISRTGATI